jgi:spermidine synthase
MASSSRESHTVGEFIQETGFYQSIRLTDEAPLCVRQSKFQKIEVRESPFYGKVLVLDGVVQLTEKDADAYNEMLTHVPLFLHRQPKRVLIIGGGDGYVLQEVLKHPSVEYVDHVDLDGDVVEVCKQHFPWYRAWEDERVKLHIADGAAFVREAADAAYDVIIQDSSDPWTWRDNGEQVMLPSSVLYSPDHFGHIHRVLRPAGIFNMQSETLQIPSDLNGIREWRQRALSSGFQRVRYGTIIISSYPTGQIGFLSCEKDASAACSFADIEQRFLQLVKDGKGTSYYHPAQQSAAFVLPRWAEKHIYDGSVNY